MTFPRRTAPATPPAAAVTAPATTPAAAVTAPATTPAATVTAVVEPTAAVTAPATTPVAAVTAVVEPTAAVTAPATPTAEPAVNAAAMKSATDDDDGHRTPSSTAKAATATTLAPVNFQEILDELWTEVASQSDEPERFLDCDVLSPEHLATLAALAAELGIPYDPATASTFELIITKSERPLLMGPQLYSYGDTGQCCISWPYILKEENGDREFSREHVVSIPLGASCQDVTWRLILPEQDSLYCTVLYGLKQYCFPFPVRFIPMEDAKKLRTKLLPVTIFDELAPLLQDGSPQVQWEDGVEYRINTAEKLTRTGDGSEYLLCKLEDAEGQPHRCYLNEVAVADILPAMVSKVKDGAQLSVVSENGEHALTVPLGGNISKLSELEVGRMYLVASFDIKDGKERQSATMVIHNEKGSLGTFWANSKFGSRVLNMEDPQNTQGFILITGMDKTKDGKKFAKYLGWFSSDLSTARGLKTFKRHASAMSPAFMAYSMQHLPEGSLPAKELAAAA